MQKRFAIKIVCMLMSLLLLLCSLPLSASAAEITPPSMEEASAVYLKHLQSDYLVCSKNENISLGAGSTVKVMAGLIFCERLATILQEPILITPELYDAIPSTHGRSLKIQENDVVTVENLLYAAICGSYNDAFYLLAAWIGGSVEGFLALMNDDIAFFGIGFYLDRAQNTAARIRTVSGIDIHVQGAKATRTVIAGAVTQRLDGKPTVFADEGVVVFCKSFLFHKCSP